MLRVPITNFPSFHRWFCQPVALIAPKLLACQLGYARKIVRRMVFMAATVFAASCGWQRPFPQTASLTGGTQSAQHPLYTNAQLYNPQFLPPAQSLGDFKLGIATHYINVRYNYPDF